MRWRDEPAERALLASAPPPASRSTRIQRRSVFRVDGISSATIQQDEESGIDHGDSKKISCSLRRENNNQGFARILYNTHSAVGVRFCWTYDVGHLTLPGRRKCCQRGSHRLGR